VLAAVGVVLRVSQYLVNSSLWLDEAALARNIIDRSVAQLFRPLDYAQVAPIGFLLVEKGVSLLFGTSEYALRAFPLACGIASIFLFWRLAERVVSGWTVPFAVGLFAIATPAVYFSSQVKQYSVDVLVSIALLLASTEIRRRGITARRASGLGVLGLVAVWFSQPAVFVLAGIGAGFALLAWLERDREASRRVAITLTLWAVAAGVSAFVTWRMVPPSDRAFMRVFWAEGFMPMPPHRVADLFWIVGKLTWAFGKFGTGMTRTTGGLNYRWSFVFTLTALAGLWGLWKRRRDAALFLALPIAVVAVLSVASVYPFTARLVAFLVPYLLLAVSAGAEFILSVWPPRLQILQPAAMAILGGAPLYAAVEALPPWRLQHVRPIFETIARQRQPGDAMYVHFSGGQAFYYYAPRFGLDRDVRVGACAVGYPRNYLRELDRFRGRRLWMVISHAHYNGAELEVMLQYLDTIGRRLESLEHPATNGRWVEGAWGYLFDLTDPKRLAAASADSFPIAPGPLTDPPSEWACYGVFLPERNIFRHAPSGGS